MTRASSLLPLVLAAIATSLLGCAEHTPHPRSAGAPPSPVASTRSPVTNAAESLALDPPVRFAGGLGHTCRIEDDGLVHCRDDDWNELPLVEPSVHARGLFVRDGWVGVFDDQATRWPIVADGPAAGWSRYPSKSWTRAVPPRTRAVYVPSGAYDSTVAYALDEAGAVFYLDPDGDAPRRLETTPSRARGLRAPGETWVVLAASDGSLSLVTVDKHGAVESCQPMPRWRAVAWAYRGWCAADVEGRVVCRNEEHGEPIEVPWSAPVLDLFETDDTFVARDSEGRMFAFSVEFSGERRARLVDGPLVLELPPARRAFVSAIGAGWFDACVQGVDGVDACVSGSASDRQSPERGFSMSRTTWVDAEARRLPQTRSVHSAHHAGCAVALDGRVRCWGHVRDEDRAGRGMLPETVDVPTPVDIQIGERRICLLLADGRALCASREAEAFHALRFERHADDVRRLRLRSDMACALLASGRVSCEGTLRYGERGILEFPSRALLSDARGEITDAVDVVLSDERLCVVRASRELFCLEAGARAEAPEAASASRLARIEEFTAVKEIVSTERGLCVVAADERAYCLDELSRRFRRESRLDGGPLVPLGTVPTRVEDDLAIEEDAELALERHPWEALPPLVATASGGLVGFLPPNGEPRSLCQRTEGPAPILRCYGEVPDAPRVSRESIEALGRADRELRSREVPRLVRTSNAHARIYEMYTPYDVLSTDVTTNELCANRHLSRAGRASCPGLPTRGVPLRAEDAAEVEALVRDPASYSTEITHCYQPHHEVIYFDARHRVVARVEICFECGQVRTDPSIEPRRPRGSYEFWGDFRYLDTFRRLCRTAGLDGCERE